MSDTKTKADTKKKAAPKKAAAKAAQPAAAAKKAPAGQKAAPARQAQAQAVKQAQGGGARKAAPAQSARPQPALAQSPSSLDQTIARAQHGRVNVTPAKAVEMAGKLYSEGKYKQAARVCQQVIAARPGLADAHNILGVTLAALGNRAEAQASLKRAVKLAPEAASIHGNLGEIYRLDGRMKDAAASLKRAVELDPANAQALNNLGIVHYENKDFDAAIAAYRKAIAKRPAMAEAHNNLGNALRMIGDPDGAMQSYQEALVHRAVYPEAYNNLGTLLQQDQRLEEAEHALKKAVAQGPRYVEAHNNLATLHFANGQEVEALRVLGEALKFAPEHPGTLLLTAKIQLKRNNFAAAEQAARLAIKGEPDNADALTVLGQLLHETDRYEEAITVLEKALEHRPDSPEARNFYGVALKSVGRLDEAREHILAALKKNDSMYGAYANLNDLVDFSKETQLYDRMEAILEAAPDPMAEPLLPLHFAFAKALDDKGEHERALDHYIVGGKMKRKQLNYVEEETFGFFDGIRKAFPASIFKNRPFAGNEDERPVFIIGMPRSGSTLVEQILSSHPDVYGAGEVKYLSRSLGLLRDRFPSLPKYPQMMEKITPAQMELLANGYIQQISRGAGDHARITDKLLTNYFFVGLIHLLFPKAKFINTMRDPVDTCLSGFTKLFKDDMPHSYDLTELGHYYGKYNQLMEHWNAVLPKGVMTTIHYQETVENTEKEAKRLIDFLGLEWNKACLEFHKSSRPVKTASVAQVRKPIYKSSLQRWKKYGDGLKPLAQAINEKPKN